MNYSHALKGRLTAKGINREISSQCELEIGRPLTAEEISNLFQKWSPRIILDRIQKV